MDILDKMKFKINFTQYSEDIHDLYIYHSVSVPHNFSGIPEYTHKDVLGEKIYMIKFNSGYVIETFMILPPIQLHEPLGLNSEFKSLFFNDNEVKFLFSTTNEWHISVTWDISYGEMNMNDEKACHVKNHTHHTLFCNWPPQNMNPSKNGTVYIHNGYWLDQFQHSLDHGIPSMSTAMISNDIDPKTTTLMTTSCNKYMDMIISKVGFSYSENCKNSSEKVSAKRLIVVAVMRSTHTLFYSWYYDKMKFPDMKRDKIIIFPRKRKGSKQSRNDRIVFNLVDIKKSLEDRFGQENVFQIDNGCQNLSFCLDLLPKTKYIIGPHGGALYNAFFAGKDVNIIELLPIRKNGQYPAANNKYWAPNSVITFAQMASQKIYRYYTFSNEINYLMNVTDFLNWFYNSTNNNNI